MFSRTVERVLNAAAREAVSRRHAHLTLEHLLFAVANEVSGEKILRAAGADTDAPARGAGPLPGRQRRALPSGSKRAPEQTLAFRRVLQTAVLHVQSAGKTEADVGDILAALLAQPRSHAVDLLTGQGVTRLDILNYISHGDQPTRRARRRRGRRPGRRRARARRAPATARDPLAAYTVNLTERARQGKLDPLIGRSDGAAARAGDPLPAPQEQPRVRGRPRAWARPRSSRGWPCGCSQPDAPEVLKGAEVFALDTGALLAGHALPRRLRGALQGACSPRSRSGRSRSCSSTRCTPWSARAPPPAAPWTSPTSSSPSSPRARSASSGSTTFEEFKHVEKDRALARRVQKIDAQRADPRGHGQDPARACAAAYEDHHQVTYTDAALEAAARLARRHLRDHRLPDSAIDVLDEAGAVLRLLGTPAEGERRAVDVPEIERVVARMARIPEKQASVVRQGAPAHAGGIAAARGLRPGGGGAHRGHGHQARAGGPRPSRPPRGLLPVHRPHRRRQDRAGQAARAAPRQRVHPLRHERVRGEARGGPAHRRAPRLRGVRAGRPAGGRRAPASLQRGAAGRDREGAPRPVQHPAAGDGPRHPHRQHRAQGGLPPGHPDHDVERGIAGDERGHRSASATTTPSDAAPQGQQGAWRSSSAPSSGTAWTPSSPSRP